MFRLGSVSHGIPTNNWVLKYVLLINHNIFLKKNVIYIFILVLKPITNK